MPKIDTFGQLIEENSPFMIWNHKLYTESATLQAYRFLIYMDYARAILTTFFDLTGSNKYTRLRTTSFGYDFGKLSS